MRIGIIDSGVEGRFLREHAVRLAGAARFTVDLDAKVLETRHYEPEELAAWQRGERPLDIEDEHGHGTAVLSILYDRVRPWPDAELFVDRIFGQEIRTYAPCLVEAMRWMLEDVRADLLNLSLGTPHRGMEAPMRALVSQAVARGAIVTSTASAMAMLPAQLEPVVSVGDLALLEALGEGVKVDQVVQERELSLYMGGRWILAPMTTSFACAVATAGVMSTGRPPAPNHPQGRAGPR